MSFSLKQNNIAITQAALACCLGYTWDQVREKVLAHTSGLRTDHRFSNQSEQWLGVLDLAALGTRVEASSPDELTTFLVMAMIDELASKSQLFKRYQPHEVGFIYGTTTFGFDYFQQAMAPLAKDAVLKADDLRREMQQGLILEQVAARFPFRGPHFVCSSACSSGAYALAEAFDLLRVGALKACVAGGLDILNLLTIKGFEALQVVDKNPCRPFAADRAGINLGEGGALFLLEANPQDTEPYGFLLGSGASSDAFHMTQPQPTGQGMARAMEQALWQSQLSPHHISYINAHGTGTVMNDMAEGKALDLVFGPAKHFESTKNLTGHTLAGSGALEAAITLMNLNKSAPFGVSNSFGFGGSNLSLVLSHAQEVKC